MCQKWWLGVVSGWNGRKNRVQGAALTKSLAEEVVLTMGRSPQTQTPLPEPWLHHNHGLGGLKDCCSSERLLASTRAMDGDSWRLAGASRRWRMVAGSLQGSMPTPRRPTTTSRRQNLNLPRRRSRGIRTLNFACPENIRLLEREPAIGGNRPNVSMALELARPPVPGPVLRSKAGG